MELKIEEKAESSLEFNRPRNITSHALSFGARMRDF
jgi:hypothetical protein